jgi:hypothetical protein
MRAWGFGGAVRGDGTVFGADLVVEEEGGRVWVGGVEKASVVVEFGVRAEGFCGPDQVGVYLVAQFTGELEETGSGSGEDMATAGWWLWW